MHHGASQPGQYETSHGQDGQVCIRASRMASVDAVAGLLNGPRAQGAFLLRSCLDPPWSLRIQDRRRSPWWRWCGARRGWSPTTAPRTRLHGGDVAIMRGPDPYTGRRRPGDRAAGGHPPRPALHHPRRRGAGRDGNLGVRTWGNTPDGATVLLTGTYQELEARSASDCCARSRRWWCCAGTSWDTPLVPLLAEEIVKDDPGQEAVLDRLLDLLLIAVLRAWFARPEAAAPAWYRAHGDPVVGPALRLMHDDPAHPWTVASLAAATGVSRATLARRFTELVGEPPMAYLTSWRLALAADLLREPDATVGAVAAQVGYGSSFALSTAFKRIRGISPREHRSREAAGMRPSPRPNPGGACPREP